MPRMLGVGLNGNLEIFHFQFGRITNSMIWPCLCLLKVCLTSSVGIGIARLILVSLIILSSSIHVYEYYIAIVLWVCS